MSKYLPLANQIAETCIKSCGLNGRDMRLDRQKAASLIEAHIAERMKWLAIYRDECRGILCISSASRTEEQNSQPLERVEMLNRILE